jgi:hypothetical protein
MSNITDMQILMYLDGAADATTKTLIEGGIEYEALKGELKNFQEDLVSHLFRISCPGSLELGEYHLGVLPHTQAKVVKEHISGCPHCSRELMMLEASLAPGWMERIVAKLVSGRDPGGLQRLVPQLGLRGGGSDSYHYEAEGVQISIDVQEDSNHPGRKALIGLIIGTGGSDYEVSLWSGEKQIATASIDPLDNFMIRNLETGEYELLIRGPKVEIQVQKFMI